jgi:hypothetical protein
MRTGTRTELKRRWTPVRHRPLCRVKLGYEFTYLYCALNPAKGHLICLLLPDMTQRSFQVFLDYFEQQVRRRYGHRKVLLILDQAACHHSQHATEGVVLQYLPVASPELNCVERFFEELRKPLSNHVFRDIAEVERFLSQVLKQYYQHPKLLIQLCHYPYMRQR